MVEGATAPPGRAERWGVWGAARSPPMKSVQVAGRVVEGATAPPGRAERWGGMGGARSPP